MVKPKMCIFVSQILLHDMWKHYESKETMFGTNYIVLTVCYIFG